jgi:hypothetical protein
MYHPICSQYIRYLILYFLGNFFCCLSDITVSIGRIVTPLPPSSWQPANPDAGRRGFGNYKAGIGVLYTSQHPTNKHANN